MVTTERNDQGETEWLQPTLPPLPESVPGVSEPVLSLNGTWKLHIQPPDRFWSDEIDPASWSDVAVPGYTATQGYEIEANAEYAYRTRFQVPADWRGQRIWLRLDGVTGASRLWVNGHAVRDHYGGFTTWYCEITDLVSPGQKAFLALGVTDKPREICVFNRGGVIRDVRLVALPAVPLTRLHVETDLDGDYVDAVLKVTAAMDFSQGESGTVHLALVDPRGQPVDIQPEAIALTANQPQATARIPVAAPDKWDAEHPNLYTLRARVEVEGATVETLSKQIGFRVIEVVGNQLLVNGMEVKLRGVNRHDIYPLTGRAVTPALVEQDIRLFRDANINFIRTSHYPPREDMLEFCDRYGIYVEDEIAVAFVNRQIQPTQNNPDFTADYVNQFAEMIERDRSHPCVLMWSLANESDWGRNFQAEYETARAVDPSRPTIFSYPNTQPDGTDAYQIWSVHYAKWYGDPGQQTDSGSNAGPGTYNAPVLHDEYIHIPCYDLAEQKRDPAIREFWGESIKRRWEKILITQGALGGAIWGSIDDVMITPKSYTHAREWGIIDGWRRKKPEYWLTKKGYSPIRIQDGPQDVLGDEPLQIPVENWFDHTNLNEIEVRWSVGKDQGAGPGPDVAPHAAGTIVVPERTWQEGEVLNLRFYRAADVPKAGSVLVDAYALPICTLVYAFPELMGPAPSLVETDDRLLVSGRDFTLSFDKATGLIQEGIYQSQTLIVGGPYLNLIGGKELAPWQLETFHAEQGAETVDVTLRGRYGKIAVTFVVQIDGGGLLATTYTIDEPPSIPPRARREALGQDDGGYGEVGVAYVLAPSVDRLDWERNGLWSVYPDDHIGRTVGTASRTTEGIGQQYAEPPNWPWAHDMQDYCLYGRYDVGGRGSRDFRSMKHNVYRAAARVEGGLGVQVESDGSDAVRLEVLPDPEAIVDCCHASVKAVGTWLCMDDDPHNICGRELLSNKAGDYLEYTFGGTGIAWIGARDQICGRADVYLDGIRQAAGLDLFCGMRVPGASPGQEKMHRQTLFCVQGLPEGEHTLKIVVAGEKENAAQDAFVSVDALMVLGQGSAGAVKMIVNQEWNYPELGWGNYVKDPVQICQGYTNTIFLRFTQTEQA